MLNPELLKGKGSQRWEKARLRDRIDAIIAHEWEEAKTGGHVAALKAVPKTELPITGVARRILRTMRGEPVDDGSQLSAHPVSA